MSVPDRLYELLGELCNRELTDAEIADLNGLLVHSDAREVYADYMLLHSELYWQHLAPGQTQTTPQRQESLWGPARVAMAIASLAAMLLIGTAAGVLWHSYLTFRTPPADGAGGGTQDFAQRATVARVTGTRNCRWDTRDALIGFGTPLHEGQVLDLLEGLAEITYVDGARVILEAPAELEISSPHRSVLHLGRLTAVIPEQGSGFEVRTRHVVVNDRGAEFGVFADASGATEVQVFSGRVAGKVLDAQGRDIRTVSWGPNDAFRVDRASAQLTPLTTDESRFVRSLAPPLGPHAGLYAYEAFDYPTGPLNGQNGGYGWAGPWVDLASYDPGSNRVAAGSLVYAELAPAGNRASQVAQQNRARRVLSTSVGGVFDTAGLVEDQDGARLIGRDGTTLYISFLQRTSRAADGFYGFELHRGDGNSNRVLCIGNGASGTGFGATSEVNGGARPTFQSLGDESEQPVFFVVKIEFGVGHQDRVTIYRDPRSLRVEGSCNVTAELVGNFAFDRLGIACFDGSKMHEIDHIRVGTSFGAVTGLDDDEHEFVAFATPSIAVSF